MSTELGDRVVGLHCSPKSWGDGIYDPGDTEPTALHHKSCWAGGQLDANSPEQDGELEGGGVLSAGPQPHPHWQIRKHPQGLPPLRVQQAACHLTRETSRVSYYEARLRAAWLGCQAILGHAERGLLGFSSATPRRAFRAGQGEATPEA